MPPELRGQAAERVPHAGGLARREVAQLGLGQPRAPARGRQAREERVRGALELVQQARGRRRVVEPAGALAVAPQLRHVAQREARAEPLGGGVLELVRLVEDDGVVLGQHADGAVRGDAQAEIGEVERVVDDHDRRRRARARAPPRRSTSPSTRSARPGSAPARPRPRPRRRAAGTWSSSARSPRQRRVEPRAQARDARRRATGSKRRMPSCTTMRRQA